MPFENDGLRWGLPLPRATTTGYAGGLPSAAVTVIASASSLSPLGVVETPVGPNDFRARLTYVRCYR